jgi:hypothetical protein
MHGHGFPWVVVRVLFSAWCHVWSGPKKLRQVFVEGRPTEDTKPMNHKYTNQVHEVVNVLARPQGHASLWTKPILAYWVQGSIKHQSYEIQPQHPWWLPLKVVGGCGILVVPPTLGPINSFQDFDFLCRNISPKEQLIDMCPWSEPKILHHVVLHEFLVDFFHLNCHLPIAIHCEDAGNLPLVILVISLR